MVINASDMPASRIHPLADGQTLPGPRARPTAGNIARDLECIAAAKAGCQRCSWALRKLVSLGCRPVAGHATSCEAATAAFNPHSAPPPERRFSTTGSFDYRARATPSRAAAWARRARQSKDALHYAESQHMPSSLGICDSSTRACRQWSRKTRHSSWVYRLFRKTSSASSGL